MTDDDTQTSDGETGVVRAAYDWRTISPSVAVVQTLAIALDSEPTTIEVLHDVVDADALDSLVTADADDGSGPTVSFPIEGRSVTVDASGSVVVHRRPEVE